MEPVGNQILPKEILSEFPEIRAYFLEEVMFHFPGCCLTRLGYSEHTKTNKLALIARQINKDFAKTFPISVNFDNTDIRTVMKTFSVMTGKNILVGDEVSGNVKARVVNEDWDDVLEAILEIKNLAIVLNKETNIVRIHQKDIITEQEEYARERQAKLIDDLQQSETLDPIRLLRVNF